MVVWWVAGGVLLLLVIVQVCARSRHPIRNAVGGMLLVAQPAGCECVGGIHRGNAATQSVEPGSGRRCRNPRRYGAAVAQYGDDPLGAI